MDYVDGFVAAVKRRNEDAFAATARLLAEIFLAHGATEVTDCWGDDVPDGVLTSFPMAVRREPDEAVVFGWVRWPSAAARTAGWEGAMADPRMPPNDALPFDGKRMIYGGFRTIQTARAGA